MRRFATSAATVLTTVAVAACSSSSTPGQGNAGGSTPTDASGLAAKMVAGIRNATSAHLDLKVSAAGQSFGGGGDEQLSHGKLVGLDLTESVGGMSLRIIVAGGKTYFKLPPALNKTGKPYVLVQKSSSNPVVAQLAQSLGTALSAASVKTYGIFVKAAKSVTLKGHDTVNGAPATHYAVVVDISKVPSSAFNKAAIAASGVKTVPVDLWIDDQGRPVKVQEHLSVQGQSVDVNATVTKYNQHVHITAPPANQVSTN